MRASCYEDMEQKGSFLVYEANDEKEAIWCIELEDPELRGKFKPHHGKHCDSHKCLDCGSYWISEDVCGECGEDRLSKRSRWCWYFDGNLADSDKLK